MKSYYDFLVEELENFEGSFDKFVLYTPELFKLLCTVMDEDINIDERRLVGSALAYFVLPNDVISEEIYGPMGYVDDIYVCVVVLDRLIKKRGISWLEPLWEYDEPVNEVLKVCRDKSLKILTEKQVLNDVLSYSGLGVEK